MIKLHGIALSNYTNMVRTALDEKSIPYEMAPERPSQDEAFTAHSPMGKVPWLELPEGDLCETAAILDYLEDIQPEPALLPATAFERAKVRELVQALGLYIELPARRGLGLVFGREVSEHAKESMRRDLPRGARAITQLCRFSPWIAGESFTYADLYGYYTFGLAGLLAREACGLDLFELVPGSQDWSDRVGERPAVAAADADMAKARAALGR